MINSLSVPVNSTWANIAWGEGHDSTSGRHFIDLDLFEDHDKIKKLHEDGHKVICYFSAGTWEKGRPDGNKSDWAKVKIGKMDGWDELWLDIRKLDTLKTLMGSRMDLAHTYGCDGVEPDNIDCSDNKECWHSMTSPSVSSGSKVKAD